MAHQLPRKPLSSLVLAAVFSLVLALPAMAWQAEGGTKNCGQLIAFVHARYNDTAALQGPGGTTGYYVPNDGLWHTQERNGSYSGDWTALGDPYLDLVNTWPGCRNYG